MAGRPVTKIDRTSTARTVHIEADVWDRIMTIAFMSKPRRSASDVVRDMIQREIDGFESDIKVKAS